MKDGTVIMIPETVAQTSVAVKKNRTLDIGLFILRLAVGGLMLFHGIAKINQGVEMIKPMLATKGLPEWSVYGLYIAEVLAPVMILLGIWTRLAAVTILIDMVMAVFLVHSNDIFSLNKAGAWAIEIEAFYFVTALALCFTGAGIYRLKKSGGRWD